MIFYPLSTLMMAGIQDILIITTPDEQSRFQALLGDGHQWGVDLHYATQPTPGGLAQAFTIGAPFVEGHKSALILGDNLFYGHDLQPLLRRADARVGGASVFAYHVNDPERYGVIAFDKAGKAASIEEKPSKPLSNFAVTGLYFYDETAVEKAKSLKPSKRGELEITDLNRLYLEDGQLFVERMERGFAWLDTGTHDSLLEANQFVATLEKRQGLKICAPEEIAWRMGYIDQVQLRKLGDQYGTSEYGQYLRRLSA
jgi:glucose-1-phosphate thymidylyltransferase